MKPEHWRQRLLKSTRGQILALLRAENRTVNDLAAVLHLTDNAVRAHLAWDLLRLPTMNLSFFASAFPSRTFHLPAARRGPGFSRRRTPQTLSGLATLLLAVLRVLALFWLLRFSPRPGSRQSLCP